MPCELSGNIICEDIPPRLDLNVMWSPVTDLHPLSQGLGGGHCSPLEAVPLDAQIAQCPGGLRCSISAWFHLAIVDICGAS